MHEHLSDLIGQAGIGQVEFRDGRKRANKKGNRVLDLLNSWIKSSGQEGTDQARNSRRAAHERLGDSTLPDKPPPAVIVYQNEKKSE